jgi:hypothetical protein
MHRVTDFHFALSNAPLTPKSQPIPSCRSGNAKCMIRLDGVDPGLIPHGPNLGAALGLAAIESICRLFQEVESWCAGPLRLRMPESMLLRFSRHEERPTAYAPAENRSVAIALRAGSPRVPPSTTTGKELAKIDAGSDAPIDRQAR